MDLTSIPINPGHAVILTVVLGGIGKALKSHKTFPNHWIPVALSGIGAPMNGWLNGWNAEQILVGAGFGMVAVGGHQIIRQFMQGKEPEK